MLPTQQNADSIKANPTSCLDNKRLTAPMVTQVAASTTRVDSIERATQVAASNNKS
jgi:hypothetical protein